ncbi:MAG TPA: adenylosuccinate synthetase, partial [Candidatus Paceibacterota bacterium]
EEIVELEEAGNSYNGLRISSEAPLVLPFDIALDRLREAGRGAIGTTGRGIGPVYESRVARIGLTVNDLLNKDVFAAKLRRNLAARIDIFRQFDPVLVAKVLRTRVLEGGIYYLGEEKIFDVDAIVERYLAHAGKFSELIVDTDTLLRQKVADNQRVLLEGAQGVLLSVLYGSYPYVTSSDCSLTGLAEGVGLRSEHVDYTLGVVKAPYMTRVGKGPFPTELGGEASATWCNSPNGTKGYEQEKFPHASVNSADPFEQGVALRHLGNEYGSTTGRLRRVGWLDLPLLRYAKRYGSKQGLGTVALTKVDVMSSCETVKLCIGYEYQGEDYRVGARVLTRGTRLETAIIDSTVLERSLPIYEEFPGWMSDLSGIRSRNDLPLNLRKIIAAIERNGEVAVDVLSLGPDRDETLVF